MSDTRNEENESQDLVESIVINGLIIAGGQSSRMGTEKALLERGGASLLSRGIEALKPSCAQVFVSARENSLFLSSLQVPALYDDLQNIGPAAALLRAYRESATADWFFVAVDFPFMNEKSVAELLARHLKSETAEITCYMHADGTPEPLFAVWTPAALEKLSANVRVGRTGPIQTLGDCEVQMLKPRDQRLLFNTNTPSQWSEAST